MGIQFNITIADDRIEVARGACIFAIDRTTAMPHDYATIGEAVGDVHIAGFIRSLAPTVEQHMQSSIAAMVAGAGPELLDDLKAMADALVEETPLEQHIRQLDKGMVSREDAIEADSKARIKFDRERWAGQAKATRIKAGDSQEAAAKAIGTSGNVISLMETGSRNMADATAIEIAKKVISHYSASANEKPLPTKFGAVLRAARKARHLSTDELGAEMGLSRNYILKIEKDPFNAGPRSTVEKIAAFLGVLNIDRFWAEAA